MVARRVSASGALVRHSPHGLKPASPTAGDGAVVTASGSHFPRLVSLAPEELTATPVREAADRPSARRVSFGLEKRGRWVRLLLEADGSDYYWLHVYANTGEVRSIVQG
jgi:hypothetical protein